MTIVNEDTLTAIDPSSDELMRTIREAQAVDIKTDKDLKAVAEEMKQQLEGCDMLRRRSDREVTLRLYRIGGILIAVKKYLGKAKTYNEWVKQNIGERRADYETARQAVNIASCGPEILDYAHLGKNRVLEIRFMINDMPEVKTVDAEATRKWCREIEARHPFPAHGEMSDVDVKECRLHMDAIITQYRVNKQMEGTEAKCSFSLAKKYAGKKGLAIEVGTAKKMAELWKAAANPKEEMRKWMRGAAVVPPAGNTKSRSGLSRVAEFVLYAKELVNEDNQFKEGVVEKFSQNETAKESIKVARDILARLCIEVGLGS